MENLLTKAILGFNNFSSEILIKNSRKYGVNIKEVVELSPVIGIEVEMENIPNWVAVPGWTPKEDNSLRNCGVEYVSLPIPFCAVKTALNLLFEKLAPKNPEFSKRTSIHIHLNALDLYQEEIYKFILLYCIFEKCLYKFVSSERKRNIFCVPLYHTAVGSNIKCLYDKENFITIPWYKYLGLNLKSLQQYGTIEFRHLQGTNDIDLIFSWVELIVSLYHFSKSLTKEELEFKVNSLNTTSQYAQFLFSVFPNCSTYLTTNREYPADMATGISFVKSDILQNDFVKYIERASNYSKINSKLYKNMNEKKS